ncbi:hypothetical protein, partial [Acidovorax sp.]|uniref:hypothetical protein n=1 Tax=Acidovorax sp. TaxID=1872122 RepID=UPI0025C59560
LHQAVGRGLIPEQVRQSPQQRPPLLKKPWQRQVGHKAQKYPCVDSALGSLSKSNKHGRFTLVIFLDSTQPQENTLQEPASEAKGGTRRRRRTGLITSVG